MEKFLILILIVVTKISKTENVIYGQAKITF